MSEKNPDERKAEAEARQAEAAARQAEAAARQAEREREEWESELAKQAREATQRQTIAEADEKAREAAHTLSDEFVQQKLEADAKKAIAEADKATFEAETAQVSALIPDFSKVEKGDTAIKGDQPAFGALLGRMALEKAAANAVEKLPVSKGDVVLITTEADLASTDVVYLEVVTGLATFTDSANDLLAHLEKPRERPLPMAVGPIAAAIASAAPGLLSLFSADRSLSSFAVTADKKAAVAAVASVLVGKEITVQIDDFRVTQGGHVAAKEKALREARSRLVERKLELEADKAQAGNDKKAALDKTAELEMELAGLDKSDPKRSDIEDQIRLQQQIVDSAKSQEHEASVAIALVSELITGIDAFLGALHTIPSGGKRSPFATAVLRQQLRDGGDGGSPTFTKILFIEASAGAVDQLVNDRPLLFKDKFHSIGSVAVTYWVMDPSTSNIQASGVASGVAQIRGKIGSELEWDTDFVT